MSEEDAAVLLDDASMQAGHMAVVVVELVMALRAPSLVRCGYGMALVAGRATMSACAEPQRRPTQLRDPVYVSLFVSVFGTRYLGISYEYSY